MRNICTTLLWVTLLLLALGQHAEAQSGQTKWQQKKQIITQVFAQSDGLPVVSLTDMVQGSDGYIYIASSAGVSRFNGSDFEEISTEQFPQLNSNRIISLNATPDSSIWMVDEQGFFSRWKNGSISTYNSLFKSEVQSEWYLRSSHLGSTWITDYFNFMVYDAASNSFVKKLDITDTKVYNFLPISETLIFILTEKGLLKFANGILSLQIPANELPFDPKVQSYFYLNTNLTQISPFEITVADSGALGLINFRDQTYRRFTFTDEMQSTPPIVLKVNDKELLVPTLNGHFNLNLDRGTFTQFKGTVNDQIWSMNYDPLWHGKRLYISENGVYYDDHKIFAVNTDERIAQSIQDNEGNLWITVAGLGLVRISLSPFSVLDSNSGLQSDNTYSIIEDRKKAIWIASFEFGIHKVEKSRIQWWSMQDGALINNLARSLYERKDGTIISGFWDSGLFQVDGSSWNSFLLNDSLLLGQAESFYEDETGNFWIGSRSGLFMKDARETNFSQVHTPEGANIPRVQVIQKDPDNNLWFGTHGSGLLVKNNEEIDPIRFIGIQPQPKIRDLYFQSKDTLWVATETSGLIRVTLDENNEIVSYKTLSQKDGLPDIGVHRILPDQYGFMWLPTNQGLFRVQNKILNDYLDELTPFLWARTFTEADGMPIREANGGTQSAGMVTSANIIWVPTQKGVLIFDPADFLNINQFVHTRINVSNLQTEDHNYSLFGANSLRLEPGERSVNISFDLVHFSNPENVVIEYRIPSLNSSWIVLSKDRELSITNLPPGIHQIETRLANVPDSLFEKTNFQIHVPSFFYERDWFYALSVGLVLTLIAAFFWQSKKEAQSRENLLNKKVIERTRLLNEQKVETEKALQTISKQAKELEQLNEVKTNFFINMTHELRTPLTLIKGPLNLLKDTSRRQDIDQEELITIIDRNSTYLNNVVDQLLDLLRLEGDPNPKTLKKIELVSFTRNLASNFFSAEDLINKKFSIPEVNNQLYIYANPDACSLIINNLLSNAIKYTEPNDHISVKVFDLQKSIVFEVMDTGIGISEMDKKYIFDPFYRAEHSSYKQGSGIGLSIVKNFINRMGGDIFLKSELNKGTSVQLHFPKPNFSKLGKLDIYKEEQPEGKKNPANAIPKVLDDSKSSTFNKKEPQENTSSKASLLLVEDSRDLQLFMTRLLEINYNLQIANNGIEALNYLKGNLPDLIISDLMMPKMNGIQFIQQIRSDKNIASIPIIILSAKKTARSITEGLSSGAQVYLTKPFDNNILIAQIESLLERERRLKAQEIGTPHSGTIKNDLQIEIDTLILRHISEPSLTVQSIADTLHVSRPTLFRKWKEISDVNLSEYIIKARLSETIKLIEEKKYTFSEASSVCGFTEASYFSRVFKKYYGMTPSVYFNS